MKNIDYSQMTDDELRFAVAKAKGWDVITPYWDKSILCVKPPHLSNFARFIGVYYLPLPVWTTDIAAAWELVMEAKLHIGPTDGNEWYCSNYHDFNTQGLIVQFGNTIQRAICLTWLAWKESEASHV